jgi:hypothetical protein
MSILACLLAALLLQQIHALRLIHRSVRQQQRQGLFAESPANLKDDITVSPPADGVSKIVMKFGGSSLATADRITYVSR